jgi:hypothetical protein
MSAALKFKQLEQRWPKRGPLSLDEDAYVVWRAAKIAAYPKKVDALRVTVKDLAHPSRMERAAIGSLCVRANMAIYKSSEVDPASARPALRAFAAAFGLKRAETHHAHGADGVVAIQAATSGGRLAYIPYSNKALSWHTNGYYSYNGPSDCVQAMVLHCVRGAAGGGVNALLDHEIAYIRLRDRNPCFIEALMHPQAMTIPAGEDGHGHPRPYTAGPVFFLEPEMHSLVMRYTARKRNVIWRDDAATREAVNALEGILESDPLIIRAKLRPGEGLICNNTLQNRSFFADGAIGPGRLLYRMRFHDRIGL